MQNEKIKNSYLQENTSPMKGRNTILSHIDVSNNASDKKNSHNDKKDPLADSNERDGIAASPGKQA